MEENNTNIIDEQLKKAAQTMHYAAPSDAWDDIYLALHPKRKKRVAVWWLASTLLLLISTAILLKIGQRENANEKIIVKQRSVNDSIIVNKQEEDLATTKKSEATSNSIEALASNKVKPNNLSQNFHNAKSPIGKDINVVMAKIMEKNDKYLKTVTASYNKVNIDELQNSDIEINDFEAIRRQFIDIEKVDIKSIGSIVSKRLDVNAPQKKLNVREGNGPYLKRNKSKHKNFDFVSTFAAGSLQLSAKNAALSDLQKSLNRNEAQFNNSSNGITSASIRSDLKKNTNLNFEKGTYFNVGLLAKYKNHKTIKPYIGLQMDYMEWQNKSFQSSYASVNVTSNNSLFFDATKLGSANFSSVPIIPLHNNMININNSAIALSIPIGVQFVLNKKNGLLGKKDKFLIDASINPSVIIKDNIYYHDNATDRYFLLSSVSKKLQVQSSIGLLYQFGRQNQFGIGAMANTYLFNINNDIKYIQPLQISSLGLKIYYTY